MEFESETNLQKENETFDPAKMNKDYHSRYKHLKTTIQQLIFENAALTREISNTDAQLISAKVERKALLKRLSQYEKPESKMAKTSQRKASTSTGVKKKIKQESEICTTAASDRNGAKHEDSAVGDNKNVKIEKSDS